MRAILAFAFLLGSLPLRAQTPPQQDLQAKLDLQIYRLNTACLVARVLELRGKLEDSAKLRTSMRDFEKALQQILAEMRAQGRDPFVPDYCRADDVPMHLDQNELTKMTPQAADKAISDFVAAIKAGSRARLIVKRGTDWAEFDIIYHQRPKELYSIIQLASIIPGTAGHPPPPPSPPGAGAKPVPPPPAAEVEAPPHPLTLLADAARRAEAEARAAAVKQLRERAKLLKAPNVFLVAAHFLARSEDEWNLTEAGRAALQTYFEKSKVAEAESFEAVRHAAALKDLAGKVPGIQDPAAAGLLYLFAAAHAADAVALGGKPDEIAKLAEPIRLFRTPDAKRWGNETSVPRYELITEALSGRKLSGVAARYESKWKSQADPAIRYLAAYLLLAEAMERNQGGFEKLCRTLRQAAKDLPRPQADTVGALADGLETVAKCTDCENGRIKCPKCGGDGKREIKCPVCDGQGRLERGGGIQMCNRCVGGGILRSDCNCAPTGNKVPCPKCKGRMWFNQLNDPSVAQVAALKTCEPCRGEGSPAAGVAVACEHCFGLGRIVDPVRGARAQESHPKKELRRP